MADCWFIIIFTAGFRDRKTRANVRHPALFALAALVFALLPSLCPAQAPLSTTGPSGLTVSLITMGPGEEIYEKFGHNALWVHDPAAPTKYQNPAFNYGLFAFGGDFIPRFILGTMRYEVAPFDAYSTFDEYRAADRSIFVQTLRLSDDQATRLNEFLWNNTRPANRFYTYNYYNDNCSTRVRDALDRTVDGQIRRQTESIMTPRTYRDHTLRAMSGTPLLAVGTDFLLGHQADRPLSRWEEMFLPEYLQAYLREVNITDAAGRAQPIILDERTIYTSARPPLPDSLPDWRIPLLILGLVSGGALLLLSRLSSRWRAARWALATLSVLWILFTAFAGGLLSFMDLFTAHWAAYDNENLLQMSPLALLTVGVLLVGLIPSRLRRVLPASLFRACSAAVPILLLLTALSSLLGLALKLLPSFYQRNWGIILWVLPIHLCLAIISLHKSRTAARSQTKEL